MRILTFSYILLFLIISCDVRNQKENNHKPSQTGDTIPTLKPATQEPLREINISFDTYRTFGPLVPEYSENSISEYVKKSKSGSIECEIVVKMMVPNTEQLCLEMYIKSIDTIMSLLKLTKPHLLSNRIKQGNDFSVENEEKTLTITSSKITDEILVGGVETRFVVRWIFRILKKPDMEK